MSESAIDRALKAIQVGNSELGINEFIGLFIEAATEGLGSKESAARYLARPARPLGPVTITGGRPEEPGNVLRRMLNDGDFARHELKHFATLLHARAA